MEASKLLAGNWLRKDIRAQAPSCHLARKHHHDRTEVQHLAKWIVDRVFGENLGSSHDSHESIVWVSALKNSRDCKQSPITIFSGDGTSARLVSQTMIHHGVDKQNKDSTSLGELVLPSRHSIVALASLSQPRFLPLQTVLQGVIGLSRASI